MSVPLSRVAAAGDRLVQVVGAASVLLMMGHTVANAVLRTVANSPITGTTEYVGYWYLPMAAFLGFVCAQRRSEHIEARLAFDRLPRGNQVEFAVAGHLITVALCLGFAYFGAREAIEAAAIGLTGGVTGVVIWPATFVVPVAFGLLALAVVADAVAVLRGHTKEHMR